MTPSLSSADVSRVIREASTDALAAIRQIAVDPVGGLASSFNALGQERGRAAGVTFGIVFALLSAIAAVYGASKISSQGGLKVFFGTFFLALVPFAAIAATSAGLRRIAGGRGLVASDVFTAGVALQPLGVLFMLAAFLGVSNFSVVAVLALFAWTYAVCILFIGSTRFGSIPERFAPAAVATMLLMAIWLTKVAATSLFDSSSPIGRFFH